MAEVAMVEPVAQESPGTPGLAEELTLLAARLAAGEARFLELLGEFDRRGEWAEWGVLSCACPGGAGWTWVRRGSGCGWPGPCPGCR